MQYIILKDVRAPHNLYQHIYIYILDFKLVVFFNSRSCMPLTQNQLKFLPALIERRHTFILNSSGYSILINIFLDFSMPHILY